MEAVGLSEKRIIKVELHKTVTPGTIDNKIVRKIDQLTSENSSIWSCPDFNRREYVHSFFQYPAMMIPIVQKKVIEIIVDSAGTMQNMLDPFMGSATTLVACMESGLNCFGQDINPLAILIAKVRTGPFYHESIGNRSKDLLTRVKADRSKKIEANFSGINKWFKPSVKTELSRIVRAIRCEERLAIRRFFWVILAETIRLSSNDRTSTFKLHARPIEEINERKMSAINIFENHLKKSIDDYKGHANLLKKSGHLLKGVYKRQVGVKLLDSKQSIYTPSLQPFFDLIVSSPPYGDNRTTVPYGQHSYLPLQWIDLKDIDSKATSDFLRTTSEIDTRSLGGKLSQLDGSEVNSICEVSPSFRGVYNIILNDAPKKLSKISAFIVDLNKTIDGVVGATNPNGYLVWTIGNRRVNDTEVPNDRILKELLTSKGCILVKQLQREILNKRMAKRNKDTNLMTSEDILIFRKVG